MQARVAATYSSNQWPTTNFYKQVDHNERAEVAQLAAYGEPIDLPAIRQKVMLAILSYAIPAGNA